MANPEHLVGESVDRDEGLKFKNTVIIGKKERIQIAGIGRRIPLYTDKELERAKAHKKPRKCRIKKDFQPGLLNLEFPKVENIGIFNSQGIVDPEKKLVKLHGEFGRPPNWRGKDSLVDEDIKHIKLKLRNIIGLPIARGKDPHVGDAFYKFLVKRIVNFDVFGIFSEFKDLKHDGLTDLDVRIGQVKDHIGDVLNSHVGLREKRINYYKFVETYNKEWKK